MKFFEHGQKRLLSLVLTLVLLVSLVPVISLPAYAENLREITVCPYSRYSSGCLYLITIQFKAETGLARAYGKFAIHSSTSPFSFNKRYSSEGNASWPSAADIKAKDSTFVAFSNNARDDYAWTGYTGGDHQVVTFEDGIIRPNTTYYLYLWTLSNSYGVYPEQLIGTISSDDEGNFYFEKPSFGPAVHTHQWKSDSIEGNGTKEASTAIFCADMDCDAPMQVDVTLTASDVTLPGDVFSAEISVEKIERPAVAFALRPAPQAPAGLPEGLPAGLTISEPVYKYSATGSGYEPIDPASFTPKAGYYQAAVQITDDNNNNSTVAELAVKYTVSDPAVTAATGDNRPIELMIMGMAFFCAMAAAAFVLDGRRKAH